MKNSNFFNFSNDTFDMNFHDDLDDLYDEEDDLDIDEDWESQEVVFDYFYSSSRIREFLEERCDVLHSIQEDLNAFPFLAEQEKERMRSNLKVRVEHNLLNDLPDYERIADFRDSKLEAQYWETITLLEEVQFTLHNHGFAQWSSIVV
jgi:hypothetical protein